MFSSPFNRTAFNTVSAADLIRLQTVFSDLLAARMGVGMEYHLDSVTFSGSLMHAALGASGIPDGRSFGETLFCQGRGILASPVELLFSEALFVHAKADAVQSLSASFGEGLALRGTAGAKLYFLTAMTDELRAQSQAGADITLEGTLAELLSLRPELSVLEEQTALFSVTLPPGGELRIDSGSYTVTLNGENVLHLQQGDWIFADPALCAITVDSGTGAALEGEALFTARYL